MTLMIPSYLIIMQYANVFHNFIMITFSRLLFFVSPYALFWRFYKGGSLLSGELLPVQSFFHLGMLYRQIQWSRFEPAKMSICYTHKIFRSALSGISSKLLHTCYIKLNFINMTPLHVRGIRYLILLEKCSCENL